MTYIEPTLWAQKQFGQADLNDPRRTQRLVALAASLAEQPGVPISKLIISPADMEGAYRFIRNEKIKAEDIADAGFYVTVQEALEQQTLLALEDTTSLSYSHRSLRDELGHSNQGNRHRAMFVHSTLLFAPETHTVVGLIEQQRWTRDIKKRGQRHQHATRPYKEKESYKWEQASAHVANRLGDKMSDVISVCDREADLLDNIPLYYVGCIEQGESNEKLAWHLLTSEPITSKEEALKIVSYYEMRWLIEDFHKVWKSEGTQVEQLRMQSKDNLERYSVILAFIATLAANFLETRPFSFFGALLTNGC